MKEAAGLPGPARLLPSSAGIVSLTPGEGAEGGGRGARPGEEGPKEIFSAAPVHLADPRSQDSRTWREGEAGGRRAKESPGQRVELRTEPEGPRDAKRGDVAAGEVSRE